MSNNTLCLFTFLLILCRSFTVVLLRLNYEKLQYEPCLEFPTYPQVVDKFGPLMEDPSPLP